MPRPRKVHQPNAASDLWNSDLLEALCGPGTSTAPETAAAEPAVKAEPLVEDVSMASSVQPVSPPGSSAFVDFSKAQQPSSPVHHCTCTDDNCAYDPLRLETPKLEIKQEKTHSWANNLQQEASL